MRRLSSIPVAFALAVVAACSTPTAARSSEPSTRVVREGGVERPAEDVARELLLRATALAGAGDRGNALTLLRRVVDEFADTRARGPAAVRLAELLVDDPAPAARSEARQVLERFLLDDPAADDAGRARELLARLPGGPGRAAAASIDELLGRTPAAERGPALVRLGRELIAGGRAKDGLIALLTALPLLGTTERKGVEEDVIAALDKGVAGGGVALVDVGGLRDRFGGSDAFADQVLTWKLARAALHRRDDDGAARLARTLLQKHPSSRFAKEAAALVDRLQARVQTDARAVGVILPLSGEWAAYGKRALVAVQLAFGVQIAEDRAPEPTLDPTTGALVPPKKKDEKLAGTITTPSGVKLIVKDSANRPDVAQRAVRELVEKDHVVAVLGDILVDTALPIALACEDFGVPLLSLSRREGVPEAGPWSFRLALTPKKQARALVELAVDGLKMKRFGVMYPKKPFSVELMNEFWNELDARRAEITAIESYAHDQTTFTDEARTLVGRGLGGGGREVAECREAAKAIDNEYRRKKALEGCNDRARPIIDFEALFVPDGSRGVSYVVPALIAEDVLLTNNRFAVESYRKATGNEKVRPVLLLGPATWNDPELVARLGRQADGAVFVDGFDVDDQTAGVQRFVENFQRATRSRPSLVEAQVYDGARLLGAVLEGNNGDARGERPTTRAAVQKSLAGTQGFAGVTGAVRFDDVGDSITPPIYFQVAREKVQRVEKDDLVKGAG
jgi:ABC-type branched-subunit amino acid transport system substrate-binding protein